MKPQNTYDYVWLHQTIKIIKEGNITQVDRDQLYDLLRIQIDQCRNKGTKLTESIIQNLLQLDPNSINNHKIKGQIIRDRHQLQQLLDLNPSLKSHLQHQLKTNSTSISWHQVVNPDYFTHK